MNIKLFAIIGLCLGVAACEPAPAPQAESDVSVEEADMPPGFLDDPPPGPTSATTVLSGGTLITDAETGDAVVVVQNGLLLASGTRGEVDVPNDSVGLDMRGKWIVPGAEADLQTSGALPNLAMWQVGEPANLLILTSDPRQSDHTGGNLAGVVVNGEIRIFETP